MLSSALRLDSQKGGFVLSLDTRNLLDRAMAKAKLENHELLVFSFDRNAHEDAVEVICTMKSDPQTMQGLCQEALSVVAAGPATQAN